MPIFEESNIPKVNLFRTDIVIYLTTRKPAMYLTQPLHRAAQQNPKKLAVKFLDRQFTFEQIFNRVSRLAGALRQLDVKDGDRIAILSLNSDRYLEYQMAVPWAGGVLNPCNTRWSSQEIIYSLKDSESSILFVDDNYKEMASEFRGNIECLREIIYCGERETPGGMKNYEELIASSSPTPDCLRRGDDLAGIFYTGGSTGFPKGVMLSHNNICASAMGLHAERTASPGGTYLHAAPMFHLADMGIALPHWFEGNTHSISPPYNPDRVFDPVATLATIARDRVTHTFMVPTMIEMLVDAINDKTPDLSSLNTIIYGASSIHEVTLMRAMIALPGINFIESYGMTELSPIATIKPPFHLTTEGRKYGKHRSVGRASFHTEVRIVNEDNEEIPRGEMGEVAVRGPNVMLGYWNKPEQTAAALQDGWMRTGDGGHMDEDGFLFIADRLKDMIISGGENVYSAEVENAITQHPSVAACAVIGVPSEQWGEAVHAVVVRKAGATSSAAELVEHCRSLIAAYKCPQSVEFVSELPLSGFGKVLKTQLRETFLNSAAAKIRALKHGGPPQHA